MAKYVLTYSKPVLPAVVYLDDSIQKPENLVRLKENHERLIIRFVPL